MSESAGDPARGLLLLDTHVVAWTMFDDRRLGGKAAAAIRSASRESKLAISAISPWEIALLASKKRINLYKDVMDWVHEMLAKPGVSLVPLEPEIVVASTRLPFEMHADPADRILVATARHLGATLVTADQALLKLARRGFFRAMNAAK